MFLVFFATMKLPPARYNLYFEEAASGSKAEHIYRTLPPALKRVINNSLKKAKGRTSAALKNVNTLTAISAYTKPSVIRAYLIHTTMIHNSLALPSSMARNSFIHTSICVACDNN